MGAFRSCVTKLVGIGVLSPHTVKKIVQNSINLKILILFSHNKHQIKDNFLKQI